MTWWVRIQKDLKQFSVNFALNDSLVVHFDPLPLRGSHPLSWRARVNAINCGFITASLYLYEDRWYPFVATGQLQETRLSFLKSTFILNDRETKWSILVAQSMCVWSPHTAVEHMTFDTSYKFCLSCFSKLCACASKFRLSRFLSASSLRAQRSFGNSAV